MFHNVLGIYIYIYSSIKFIKCFWIALNFCDLVFVQRKFTFIPTFVVHTLTLVAVKNIAFIPIATTSEQNIIPPVINYKYANRTPIRCGYNL